MLSTIALLILGAASVGPPSTEGSVVLRMPLNNDTEARDFGAEQLTFAETGTPVYSATGMTLDGSEGLVSSEANWRSSDSLGAVCVWFNSSDVSAVLEVLVSSADESGSVTYWYIGYASSKLWGVVRTSVQNTTIQADTTTLVSLTDQFGCFGSDGSSYYLWVNGIPQTTSTVTGVDDGDWLDSPSGRDNVVVGYLKRSTSGFFVNGSVGPITYWDRLPSNAEILSLYNQSNPAAAHKAADTEGNLVFRVPCDSDGENRDYGRDNFLMTENGTPVYASNGCTLQAAGPDYLKADVTNYREDDNIGTVCFWANPTDGVNSSIWSVADSGSGNDYLTIDLLMLTDDSFRVLTRIGGVTKADIRALGAAEPGAWNHYCVGTNDVGTNYVLSKNGVNLSVSVVQGANSGDWVGDFGSSVIDNVTIGRLNRSSPTLAAEASVYDVRYYDTDLSTSEKVSLYNQGQPAAYIGPHSVEPGLVLNVPLIDGFSSGTTAQDLSTTGAVCTATGTPAPTFGASGDGVDLDGIDQHVDCSGTPSFTDGSGTDTAFSVAVWANVTDLTEATFIQKGGAFNAGMEYSLTSDTADSIRVLIQDDTTNGYIGRKWTTPAGVEGAWAHYVFTYDGTETNAGIRLYVNGSRVDDANVSSGTYNGMEVGADSLLIGVAPSDVWPLDGKMTAVKIWPWVLTATEISDQSVAGRQYFVEPNTSIETNVVFDAPLTFRDIRSNTVAIDYSSTQATCTATGTPPVFGATSVVLNGTSDYVDCGDADAFSFGTGTVDSAFSVCAFVDLDTKASAKFLISKGDSGSYEWALSATATNTWQFLVLDASAGSYRGVRTTGSLSDDVLYHLCGTYNGYGTTTGSFTLYRDGVEESVTAITSGTYTAMEPGSDPLKIGNRDSGYLDGAIGQVRIWDRVITPNDVLSHKAQAEPKFESGVLALPLTAEYSSGDNTFDLSVTRAVCTGSGTPAPSYGSDGVELDGADQMVDCGDSDAWSFGDASTDSKLSIAAWIRPDDATTFPIVEKATNTTTGEYGFFTSGADTLSFFVFDSTSTVYLSKSTTATISENTWTHVAVTYDGSSTVGGITILVNGAVAATTTLTSGSYTAMHETAATLKVGEREIFTNTFANGEITAVKIWDEVISLATILEHKTDNDPQ